MPFQIRKGTQAELSTFTPEVGEPIFTTDTRRLYIGDGTTQGGIRVSGDIPDSINDLNDVNIPPSPQDNHVLTWDGVAFTTKEIPPQIIEGSNYNINIVSDDSTVMVDISNNQLTGNLTGNVVGDVIGSVFTDDSTAFVDGINGTITARGFVQFGSYTSSTRPSGTNGMVIYNATAERFQGFQNGAWINLDDGSAA